MQRSSRTRFSSLHPVASAAVLVCVAALLCAATSAGIPVTDTVEFDELDELNQAAGRGDQAVGLGELVDLFNGNLLIRQPASPVIPVGELFLSLGLTYNSNSVRLEQVAGAGGATNQYLTGRSWVGLGWKMHLGRYFHKPRYRAGEPHYFHEDGIYEDSSGREFQLAPDRAPAHPFLQAEFIPAEYDTIVTCTTGHDCVFPADSLCCDGSGREGFFLCDNCGCPEDCTEPQQGDLLEPEHYLIYAPDGTLYRLYERVDVVKDAQGWPKNHDRAGYYVKSLTKHGTTVDVEYWGNPSFPEAIKRLSSPQAPGVEITTELCSLQDVSAQRCPVEGLLRDVHATGFNALDVVYEFHYETADVSDDSGGPQPISVPLLAKIVLPTVGASPVGEVMFDYGSDFTLDSTPAIHGELLTRVTYPAGPAATEFKYGMWNSGNRLANPTEDRSRVGVTQATTFPDGVTAGSSYSWSWTRDFSIPSCTGAENERSSTFAATLPDGRVIESIFDGHPCAGSFPAWGGALGTAKSTTTRNADGTDLRTSQYVWNYLVDPTTGERQKAIAQSATTTFHDDSGICFESVGAESNEMTTQFRHRNAWGQWRMSVTDGSYLPNNVRRLEYTNYHSPDNPLPHLGGCSDYQLNGTYDRLYVEEGPEAGAPDSRYEEHFEFDCQGRVAERTALDGWLDSSTVLSTDPLLDQLPGRPNPDANDVTTEWSYQGASELLDQATISGGNSLQPYVTSYTWTQGQIATVTPTLPSGVAYTATDNEIDESGLVEKSRDANGLETSYSYDELGRTTRINPPGSIEHETRIIYPDLHTVRTIVSSGTETDFDPNMDDQIYTAQVSDNLGRLVRQEVSRSDGTKAIRLTRYDQFSRVVFVSEWLNQAYYDGLPAAQRVEWTTADSGDTYRVHEVPYADGHPLGTITFYGLPSTQAGEEFNPLRATPDGLGRIQRVELADGSATTYDYCGPHIQTTVHGVVTGLGSPRPTSTAVTRSYYDGLGRLVLVDAPDVSVDAEYSYDARGSLVEVNLIEDLPTDAFDKWLGGQIPKGQLRKFKYDAAGRLEWSENPESGRVEIHSYDAAGNVLKWQDNLGLNRGYFFENTYDDAGRLATVEKVDGLPVAPSTQHVELLGDPGRFEQASDLSDSETLGKWVEGTVANNVFTAGTSSWQQTDYGGCIGAPPGGANSGGLWLGGANCTYSDAPADIQAVRIFIQGVSREDTLSYKFWRQVRDGSGSKDEFTVLVDLEDGANPNDIQDARILMRLNEAQSPYAMWRKSPASRISDLFSRTEWPEDTAATQQTRNLYLYFLFEKKDTDPAGLGVGIVVDDVTVGRAAREILAEYIYDRDLCAGSLAGEACLGGNEPTNYYKDRLAEVVSYEGGRILSRQRYVYKGLNGRVSGQQLSLDWAGSGSFRDLSSRYTYTAQGLLSSYGAPDQEPVASPRSYVYSYKRGFLDGVRDNAGTVFVHPDQSPPSFEYAPDGGLTAIRMANGVSQQFARDKMNRLSWILATGPAQGGGTATLWDSQSYLYDGLNNISGIETQEYAYDLAGRLSQASIKPQAGDPQEGDYDALTYSYDKFGNMTNRSWSHPDPSVSTPDGINVSHTFSSDPTTLTNQIQELNHVYDINGNMTRTVAGGNLLGVTWDPLNRVASFYQGHPELGGHTVAERYLYDASGMRLVRIPDAGDGRPRIQVRDKIGQIASEFVVRPDNGAAQLNKDFVYANGQLLVERKVVTETATLQASDTLTMGGLYIFDVTEGMGATTFTVEIRSPSGYQKQIAGATLVAGMLLIPEAEFVIGETNYLQIRPEGVGDASYSPPVAIAIDPNVTSQSRNQVRAISVSRLGTDVFVSFDLLQSNGEKTYVDFRRGDNGQIVTLSPVGLQPGVTSFTVQDQSLPIICGSMTTTQAGWYSNDAFLPPIDYSQAVDMAYCGGGGGGPSPNGYTFADSYHVRDHVGSIRVATDEMGWKTDAHDFYPFGIEMRVDPATGPTGGTPVRFGGHERDRVTGVDYMKARYKLPTEPHFLRPDFVVDVTPQDPSSWNAYSYVGNNPMTFNDPQGLAKNINPLKDCASCWEAGGGGRGGFTCWRYESGYAEIGLYDEDGNPMVKQYVSSWWECSITGPTGGGGGGRGGGGSGRWNTNSELVFLTHPALLEQYYCLLQKAGSGLIKEEEAGYIIAVPFTGWYIDQTGWARTPGVAESNYLGFVNPLRMAQVHTHGYMYDPWPSGMGHPDAAKRTDDHKAAATAGVPFVTVSRSGIYVITPEGAMRKGRRNWTQLAKANWLRPIRQREKRGELTCPR